MHFFVRCCRFYLQKELGHRTAYIHVSESTFGTEHLFVDDISSASPWQRLTAYIHESAPTFEPDHSALTAAHRSDGAPNIEITEFQTMAHHPVFVMSMLVPTPIPTPLHSHTLC